MRTLDRGSRLFIIAEGCLYIAFLLLEMLDKRLAGLADMLKYISVCLCLCFILWISYKEKTKDSRRLAVALLFTAAADFCLLFTDYLLAGLFFFVIVQAIYSYKIKLDKDESLRRYMVEWLGLIAVWNLSIIPLWQRQLLDPVLAAALFYFLLFTKNLIRAWALLCKRTKTAQAQASHRTFALALTLFYLCDINVGLHNISMLPVRLPDSILQLASHASLLMWFFYLPSQVLLVFTARLCTGQSVSRYRPGFHHRQTG